MRYVTAHAFREALERRLLDHARTGGSIARARKQVAFERLLRRLEIAGHDRWLLKGGFALELRLPDRARATKDIDIDWSVSEADATDSLLHAARLDVGDWFEFRLTRATPAPDVGARNTRWRATARLAGRTFEHVAIDVGSSTAPLLDPERVQAASPLSFANLQPATVPAAALEQHLAEKLHAYTRRYAGGVVSSRVKDLVDIVLISGIARFEAHRVRDTITRLFAQRATHDVPDSVPTPPAVWTAPYVALARTCALDPDVCVAAADAAAFLNPVLAGSASGRWDPSSRSWS